MCEMSLQLYIMVHRQYFTVFVKNYYLVEVITFNSVNSKCAYDEILLLLANISYCYILTLSLQMFQ